MKTNPWFAWDDLFEFDSTCKTQKLQILEVILFRFHQHQKTNFHLVISIRKNNKINVKKERCKSKYYAVVLIKVRSI